HYPPCTSYRWPAARSAVTSRRTHPPPATGSAALTASSCVVQGPLRRASATSSAKVTAQWLVMAALSGRWGATDRGVAVRADQRSAAVAVRRANRPLPPVRRASQPLPPARHPRPRDAAPTGPAGWWWRAGV